MPNLTIRDRGREFTHQLDAAATTIGRAPTNVIEIHDSKASKEHCQILGVGPRWKMVDLESKNGTRVNGDFVNKAWLSHGDTIQIGTAELRFGVEGAQRTTKAAPAAMPARRPAAAAATRAPARPAAAAAQYDDEDEFEEDTGPRRYQQSSNTALILSLAGLGLVVIVIIVSWVGGKTTVDEHNKYVIDQANLYVRDGDYDQALQYLRTHGDPSGNAYYLIEQRMNEIRERKEPYERQVKEREAREVVTKLGLKIKAYHRGKQSAQPEQILQLVERLKTEFPDTEHAASARKQWKSWFAGRVPQRAVELMNSERKLDKDWDAAVVAADEYRKQLQFREARETIERFVSAREAILDANDLQHYQRQRDERLSPIDRLAESHYRGMESRARRLLTNKRYDQAIEIFKEVIEKFGIDYYVRRAQAEIDKINKLKTGQK